MSNSSDTKFFNSYSELSDSDSEENSLRREREREMEKAIKNGTGLKITGLTTNKLTTEIFLKAIKQKQFKQQTGLSELILLSTLDYQVFLDVIQNILKFNDKTLNDQEINSCKEDFQNKIKELEQNSEYNSQSEFKKVIDQFNLLVSVLNKHFAIEEFKQQTGLSELILLSTLDDEKLCGVIKNMLNYNKKILDDKEIDEILRKFKDEIKQCKEKDPQYKSLNDEDDLKIIIEDLKNLGNLVEQSILKAGSKIDLHSQEEVFLRTPSNNL